MANVGNRQNNTFYGNFIKASRKVESAELTGYNGGTVFINGTSKSNALGSDVQISAGNALTAGLTAGNVTINAGSNSTTHGGLVNLSGGRYGNSGGDAIIRGGVSTDDVGGDVILGGGSSSNETGGNILISGGNSVTTTGGSITISGGDGVGTDDGNIILNGLNITCNTGLLLVDRAGGALNSQIAGMLAYNSGSGSIEYYDGASWVELAVVP